MTPLTGVQLLLLIENRRQLREQQTEMNALRLRHEVERHEFYRANKATYDSLPPNWTEADLPSEVTR